MLLTTGRPAASAARRAVDQLAEDVRVAGVAAVRRISRTWSVTSAVLPPGPVAVLRGAPRTGDPRIHLKPIRRFGMVFVPLSRRPGGTQAFKMIIPARPAPLEPTPQAHQGPEWLYVLNGRLRLVLGERDLVLAPGEAAEFDTSLPHWLGSADGGAVELLVLFGLHGVRARVRSGPRESS